MEPQTLASPDGQRLMADGYLSPKYASLYPK